MCVCQRERDRDREIASEAGLPSEVPEAGLTVRPIHLRVLHIHLVGVSPGGDATPYRMAEVIWGYKPV